MLAASNAHSTPRNVVTGRQMASHLSPLGRSASMRSPRLLSIVAIAMLVVACGGGNQPSSVEWRNVEFQVPAGWYVFEDEEDRLSLSNQDIGISEDPEAPREPPEGDTVAMFFTYEPNTFPEDWREFVQQQDAVLESDDQIVLQGDVPATRLIYRLVTDGIPTREMVVVIPSRSIVLLAQPVPLPGEDDAPDVFLEYLEDFLGVLETAEFGAPVLD